MVAVSDLGFGGVVGFWLVLCFSGVNRRLLAALGLMWWCDGGVVVSSMVLGSSDVGLS